MRRPRHPQLVSYILVNWSTISLHIQILKKFTISNGEPLKFQLSLESQLSGFLCFRIYTLPANELLQLPLVIHIYLIVSRLNNWKLGQVSAALISLVISLISIIEIQGTCFTFISFPLFKQPSFISTPPNVMCQAHM